MPWFGEAPSVLTPVLGLQLHNVRNVRSQIVLPLNVHVVFLESYALDLKRPLRSQRCLE